MRAIKVLKLFLLSLSLIVIGIFLSITATAFAQDKTDAVPIDTQEIILSIFGDKQINKMEYLYGFDEAADYIYVDFSDYGYAVFYRNTMEMLEYAPVGSIPFDNSTERKYYAGPGNSYQKNGSQFVNAFTKDELPLTKAEAATQSRRISEELQKNTNSNRIYDIPNDEKEEGQTREHNGLRSVIDTNNPIQADPSGTTGTTYIPHSEYYISLPEYGYNFHGTCGSTAIQLLLSFHNLYTDRRIIAPEHLNGGWTNSLGNGDRFDPANYTDPEYDPNVCTDPNTKNRKAIGTRSGHWTMNSIVGEQTYVMETNGFYRHIISQVEPAALACICTYQKTEFIDPGLISITSYTFYPDGTYNYSHQTRVRELEDGEGTQWFHTYTGSWLDDLEDGLDNILSQRLCNNLYTIDSHSGTLGGLFAFGNSDTYIEDQIDDGNPVLVGMSSLLGGINHWVVAYGYQNYTYPNGGQTYSGYIVHFGWPNGNTTNYDRVWINKSWCNHCITLELTHNTHTYQKISTIENAYYEYRCTVCGQRKAEAIYDLQGSEIIGLRYDTMSGAVTIPAEIGEVTITGIGDDVFINQTSLTQITIPDSILSIGNRTFKNCTGLTQITFTSPTYAGIISIGDEAFYGCTGLSGIQIPTYLEEIGDYAFKNCANLSQITFKNTTYNGNSSIGNETFSGCTSLLTVSLPKRVKKLGFFAFDSSTQLTSYGGTRANVDLIVPEGTSSAYQANGWQDFNYVEIRLTTAGAIKVKSGQLRGEIHIPSFLMNRSVTEVSSEAFENQTQITSVKMDAVKNINSEAFAGCSNLERVSIVSGAETINAPDHTASYTNNYYTERCLYVRLEAGKTYTFSFNYNALTTTTPSMSDVFTSLGVGEYNFAVDLSVNTSYSNTSQGTITVVFTPTSAQLASSNKLWCRFIRTSTQATVSAQISNAQLRVGVTSISSNAFDGCAKLATDGLSYRLKANNTYAIEGMAGNANVPGEILFVPSSYNGTTVTSIDAQAFRQKNIRWAFFQSGLTAIGNRAFQFCYDLELVNLSATSVTSLEDYTFDTCKLGTFLFPTTLTTIGEGAFIRTGLIGSIPNSVTSIGNYAFSYGGRKSITLPTSLITIGSYAFYQTDLPSASNLPASVTTIGAGAFKEATLPSYFALLPNNALTTIGAEAFMECDLKRIVLSSNVTSIGNNAFTYNWTLTIYTEYSGRPAGWSTTWNNSDRPIVWGCTLSSDKSYIISFNKTATNPQNQNAEDGITNPFRKDHSFGGWYTTSDFSGTSYDDLLDVPLGMVYAEWIDMSSCVAEGTLITLADGTQVAVEDLTGNEELLVWNLFTGQYDIAPILFIDHDPYCSYEITQLYFSDGTTVKIIDEHAFWDINLNRYVFLRNDAAQYIGHWFSKQDEDLNGNMIRTNVQLVNVVVYQEQTTAWSPVTYGHLCLYANGMLSMPGATEGLINIFEVDSNTMSYDATAFLADITEYGLFTYEEFAALIPISEEVFDAFNGQYLKVAIGKGLITLNEIALLVQRYATFFS